MNLADEAAAGLDDRIGIGKGARGGIVFRRDHANAERAFRVHDRTEHKDFSVLLAATPVSSMLLHQRLLIVTKSMAKLGRGGISLRK
jgi:hypothetical protein